MFGNSQTVLSVLGVGSRTEVDFRVLGSRAFWLQRVGLGSVYGASLTGRKQRLARSLDCLLAWGVHFTVLG